MLQGISRKMLTKLGSPVEYALLLSSEEIALNPLIGKKICLSYSNEIYCIQCNLKINKSFQGGYCFPCFKRLQECNLCMIHPEKCRYPEGNCNPNDWVHTSCGKPHIVYIANSSNMKIGITRLTQIPTRWIDQGAIQALPIFSVANRYQAGIIEVAFKSFLSDKTNWRAMLQNKSEPKNLLAIRDELLDKSKKEIKEVISGLNTEDIKLLNEKPISIQYPVTYYPEKIKSFNFDKTNIVKGMLLGIKGQYLILDTGVLNIRKFSGYSLTFNFVA